MSSKYKRPATASAKPHKRNGVLPVYLGAAAILVIAGILLWRHMRPLTANDHFVAGEQYEKQGITSTALAEYKRSALMDRTKAGPMYGIARIYESTGQLVESADMLGTILHYHPNEPHIQCRRAQLYGLADRYETALTIAQNAVAIEPKCATAHNAMGMLLNLVQDYKGAVRELGLAHELDPGDDDLALDYARVLALTGKHDDAQVIVEEKLLKDRHYVPAEYLEGWLLSEYGRGGRIDYDEAQRYLGGALADNSKHTASLAQAGHIFLKQGKYPAAQVELEHAHKQGPDTLALLDDLVEDYRAENNPKLAEATAARDQYTKLISPLMAFRRRYTQTQNDMGNNVKLARAEMRAGNVADAYDLVNSVLNNEPGQKDALALKNEMKNPAPPQAATPKSKSSARHEHTSPAILLPTL